MIRQLFRDESGQATTEYILMLMVAVAMAVSVIKKFLQPLFARLQASMVSQLEKTLFGEGNLHRLRIGR